MAKGDIIVTPSVFCRFERPNELIRCYEAGFPYGGLFVEDEMRLAIGQHVRVDIVLSGRPVAVQKPGIVRFKRHVQRPGIGVEFLGGRSPFYPYLMALSSGEDLIPRARRYGVLLDAECVFQGLARPCRVLDLSGRGAFVRVDDLQPLGTRGALCLRSPENARLPVEVRRRVPEEGMGLEFIESLNAQRTLRRLERYLCEASTRWMGADRVSRG